MRFICQRNIFATNKTLYFHSNKFFSLKNEVNPKSKTKTFGVHFKTTLWCHGTERTAELTVIGSDIYIARIKIENERVVRIVYDNCA